MTVELQLDGFSSKFLFQAQFYCSCLLASLSPALTFAKTRPFFGHQSPAAFQIRLFDEKKKGEEKNTGWEEEEKRRKHSLHPATTHSLIIII